MFTGIDNVLQIVTEQNAIIRECKRGLAVVEFS